MPVDHPLTFFGPYNEFAGTGKEIGYPLLRDQGNSAYMRDTGDPKTAEGGQIEWGYYEEHEPRLVPSARPAREGAGPAVALQRDLDIEQVMEPLERAMELTPILGRARLQRGPLLQRPAADHHRRRPVDGREPEGARPLVRVGIWVKDGPGMGKLIADWMTDGRTAIDHAASTTRASTPSQLTEEFIEERCIETAKKIYNPPVHPREPFAGGRDLRRSPFWEREKELGGYFMELGGWERAHGYAANEHLLEKYGDRVPVRRERMGQPAFLACVQCRATGDERELRLINLSHFHMTDIEGPDHVALMEWLCAAKIGGDANIGKGIYTHFLDDEGMVRADFTVFRMDDRIRMVNGADAGPRDYHYMRRVAQDKGFDVTITDVAEKYVTIGIWGPNARANLQKVVEDPEALTKENFPFAAIRPVRIAGKDVTAFRISYVGEQGWELHMAYEDGLAVWDALRATGVMAVGVETYANSRRLEKSLRLQNADLLTEYNLLEADLARPKVKEADFRGKAKHLEHRARDAPAGDALHAGDDRQRRRERRRALSGRHPAGDGPRHRRDAGRRPRAAVLHDLDRLRAEHRQEHRARLSALGLLPAGPQARGAVFRRDLPRRGRGHRLQAALRSGERQAAELNRCPPI